MNATSTRPPTTVLLSFSDAYADRARDIARQLESCGLRVRYDPWAGGAGLSPSSAVDVGLEGVACVVPMLTPSEATATWLDDAWKRTVFEPARARGIAVLPAWCDGELDAAPDFIRIGSFANLRDADRAHELKRLVETIKESTGDGRIDSSPLVVGAGDSDTGGGRDATGVRRDAVEAAPGHAIVVEIGREIAERVPREGAGGWDEAWLPMMRDGLYFELGVKFPEVRWLESAELAPWDFRILINDVPERRHSMRPDAVLVNDTVQAMAARGIDATPGINPANEGECAWIPASDADGVEASGLTTWGVAGFLVLSLSAALRRRAVAFLGVGEVAAMLRQAGEAHPQLVEEAVPKTVPLFVLADVLRRLVAEGVCVRNLRRILLTLADRGRREQDPLLLSEYARAALQREITHRLSRGSKQLIVLLLDPAIEDILRRAVEHTATGSYLKLEPSRLQQVLAAIREPMSVFPSYAQVPQILTVLEIRAVVRRLVAASMPALHVLSYDELMPDADVQPVGRITLDGFQARPGVRVGDRLLWG